MPFDAVSPGLTTQKGIHHGHFDRLGANGVDHVGPANPRYPFIAVWIQPSEVGSSVRGELLPGANVANRPLFVANGP